MANKHKLLIIDDYSGVKDLISEILNSEGEYSVSFAKNRVEAEDAVIKERPGLILLNADGKSSAGIAEAVRKIKECPPFVIMSKAEDNEERDHIFKKLKTFEEITLPFDIDDFETRVEDACFKAEGHIDELTGLYKKPAFDAKISKLMKKETKGILAYMSLNAYSFAANPSNPIQIQMAVYALKNELSEGLLGIQGNEIMCFIPTVDTENKIESRLNKLITVMKEAADKPDIFINAGATESERWNYSYEDMLLYADRAMEYSKNEGKNLVKFYK